MLEAIERYAPTCEITIADQNEHLTTDSPKHWLQLGTGWLQNLSKFDIIIKSPGVPPQPEFDEVKETMTSATQIFLDSIADSGATVIGITGTKGKSTTASLMHAVLQAAGLDSYLVGNIGNPAISELDNVSDRTIFVYELSSYQLMDLTVSPHIAIITSFMPEHLDYHGSLEAYRDAKSNIAKFQTADDLVFFNETSEGAKQIAAAGNGKKIGYTAKDAAIAVEETKLKGSHNQLNIAAVSAVATHLDIEKDIIRNAIQTFEPLPHRLQSLGTIDGIEWIDDAISTTPESTIAALEALGNKVSTLIVGGKDRGIDYTPLVDYLTKHPVEHLILMPETGSKFSQLETRNSPTLHNADTLEDAVQLAKKHTAASNIVLLSPAAPSYNAFKNFEEKGEKFAELINTTANL